jgi:hypothetical protein
MLCSLIPVGIQLSILIPTVPSRLAVLGNLLDILTPQLTQEIELLALTDNCLRPLGTKRNLLLNMAQGRYVIHLDDDDLVTDDFVRRVLAASLEDADVVSYDSEATLNKEPPFRVRTSLNYTNEQASIGEDGKYQDIHRKPWHWCAWHRRVWDYNHGEHRRERWDPCSPEQDESKWSRCLFSDITWGEDWSWLQQVLERAKTEVHIDAMLHKYQFSAATTLGAERNAAPTEKTEPPPE